MAIQNEKIHFYLPKEVLCTICHTIIVTIFSMGCKDDPINFGSGIFYCKIVVLSCIKDIQISYIVDSLVCKRNIFLLLKRWVVQEIPMIVLKNTRLSAGYLP